MRLAPQVKHPQKRHQRCFDLRDEREKTHRRDLAWDGTTARPDSKKTCRWAVQATPKKQRIAERITCPKVVLCTCMHNLLFALKQIPSGGIHLLKLCACKLLSGCELGLACCCSTAFTKHDSRKPKSTSHRSDRMKRTKPTSPNSSAGEVASGRRSALTCTRAIGSHVLLLLACSTSTSPVCKKNSA